MELFYGTPIRSMWPVLLLFSAIIASDVNNIIKRRLEFARRHETLLEQLSPTLVSELEVIQNSDFPPERTDEPRIKWFPIQVHKIDLTLFLLSL